jgi:EmrB/QacA subfamily drug resistance transporter
VVATLAGVPPDDADPVAIELPGADEVAVLPWPLVFRRRVAERIEASERYRWWVAWTVLAGLFSVGFTITILSVSLPRIARDLGSDTATLTWVVTGPLLAVGVLGPALGKAGDIWGQKRVYLGGLAGAGVFAGLTAVAWDAGSLIAFRVIGAAEGAATGPASMALILRSFPAEDRVKAMGYWSLVGAGAPVLGVVAGGPVVEAFGWRWIFAAQAPLTLLAVAVAAVVLPETERRERTPLDLPGAALLSTAVTSLLFGLNRGPVWGWSTPGPLVAFALAPVGLAAFAAWERRAPHPLLDLAYLRRPNFTFPIASQLFSNFAYMGGFILTPLYLNQAFGYGEKHIGLLTIARPFAFSATAPVAGYLTVRVGERVAAVAGTATVVASMVLLARVSPGTGDAAIAGALALAGVGLGVSSPALAASVANAVDAADLGIAGAAQQMIVQVGVVAGIQLAQTVQAARAADGLVASFQGSYLMLGAVATLGVAFAALVRPAPRTAATAGTAPATG